MSESVAIDWEALEAEMFRLARQDIALFAERFPDETYYGFWLDCNADYGEVLLCLNSVEALEHSAHNLSDAELQNRKAFREMDIRMYERMCEKLGEEYRRTTPNPADTEPEYDDNPDKRREELQWSPGDWRYQGFNSSAWDEGFWDQVTSLVIDKVMEDEPEADEDDDDWRSPTAERFMQTACRVLVALEQANAFDCLKRTPDFKTRCSDHDESLDDTDQRLKAVRDQMASE